jgi:hypothetical protein
MSESKEQFIHRITTLAADKVNAHYEGHVLMIDLPAASEAVYAEALRDVMRLMERDPGFVAILGPDDIRDFAAERGIDLEDTP